MISIMESFFWNYSNWGEKTPRLVFALTDEEAEKKDTEINKDNLIIKTDGIRVEKS